jgi:AraC-like DNA-binding protein
MLTDTPTGLTWIPIEAASQDQEISHDAPAIRLERKWRRVERSVGGATEDIVISRWTDLSGAFRHEEATTPPNQYFIGIALKTTRLRLTRERKAIFEGIMPTGSVYVSAPSQQLTAQFDTPFDFLHFHIASDYFPTQHSPTRFISADELNDLVLLRDSFSDQLAKTLIDNGDAADQKFAHCLGQTLAMHVARLERPQSRVNTLPKWRLKRVQDFVKANFDRCISLSDLAKVAGLSRMHFAAQFRTTTGYRPREYLLHHRIEHAKSLLSSSETPLAEVALAAGFCTQAHFSTVFKRITGETPARWRCASKNALRSIPESSPSHVLSGQNQSIRRAAWPDHSTSQMVRVV